MNWTEAYLLADMEAEEMMRAEMTDSEMLALIRALLPDTYSESKDWRTGNVTERIICLKAWLESKTEEVDRLIDILNDNRTEAQAAEIERLRSYLDRIEKASEFFTNPKHSELTLRYAHECTQRLARRALTGDKP